MNAISKTGYFLQVCRLLLFWYIFSLITIFPHTNICGCSFSERCCRTENEMWMKLSFAWNILFFFFKLFSETEFLVIKPFVPKNMFMFVFYSFWYFWEIYSSLKPYKITYIQIITQIYLDNCFSIFKVNSWY